MHPPRSTNPVAAELHGGLDNRSARRVPTGESSQSTGFCRKSSSKVNAYRADPARGSSGEATGLPNRRDVLDNSDEATRPIDPKSFGAGAGRIAMDPAEMRELYEMMKTIRTWEPARRLTLIHRVLDTLETEINAPSASPRKPRGRSGAEILADLIRDPPIDAGSTPGTRPEDELIGIGAEKHPAATSPSTSGVLSADEIRAFLKSRQPAPDDETVRQWIDDYRMEKYGR
jgi:hypothetical protein